MVPANHPRLGTTGLHLPPGGSLGDPRPVPGVTRTVVWTMFWAALAGLVVRCGAQGNRGVMGLYSRCWLSPAGRAIQPAGDVILELW